MIKKHMFRQGPWSRERWFRGRRELPTVQKDVMPGWGVALPRPHFVGHESWLPRVDTCAQSVLLLPLEMFVFSIDWSVSNTLHKLQFPKSNSREVQSYFMHVLRKKKLARTVRFLLRVCKKYSFRKDVSVPTCLLLGFPHFMQLGWKSLPRLRRRCLYPSLLVWVAQPIPSWYLGWFCSAPVHPESNPVWSPWRPAYAGIFAVAVQF